MQRFLGSCPTTIHGMVPKLAELGLLGRKPGEPLSIETLIDPDEILIRVSPVSKHALEEENQIA